MTRRVLLPLALLLVPACAHNAPPLNPPGTPAPVATAQGLKPAQLDSLWGQLQNAMQRHKWDQANTLAERAILELPASDPRVSEARMMIGDIHVQRKEYLEAAREYRRLSDENPLNPLAPDALLRVGDAYGKLWRRPELDPTYGQSALATYQELISRYPESEAAKTAAQRIAALHDKFALKEFQAAKYYLRFKAYDSAILYLKDLVVNYPRAAIVPDALARMVEAYRSLGYQEDMQETCGYLRKYHPDATDAIKSCAGVAPPAVTAGAPPAAGS